MAAAPDYPRIDKAFTLLRCVERQLKVEENNAMADMIDYAVMMIVEATA